MEPFTSIHIGKQYGMFNFDGPYSFLAMERDEVKRFSVSPDQQGFWCLQEVKR